MSGRRLVGTPVSLAEYPAVTETNPQFRDGALGALDRYFLPTAQSGLTDERPLAVRTFLEDDHRGAILPDPVATLDGTPFYLSIKGVGSTTNPYAALPLTPASVEDLTDDPEIRRRLGAPSVAPPVGDAPRFITGEVWLRGSPYGGQGLAHARTALGVSARASLTSIEGFRIAPVVKVARLPAEVEARVRALHWFRRFRDPIVQEIRLVPSNVRVYFHGATTLGTGVEEVFDFFGLDTGGKALAFQVAFLRSTVPLLTLYARTLRYDAAHQRCRGLDFYDVWLDKDAVVAPDGTVYFVDLEGVEEVALERAEVRERIEDQVFRSLYEILFAYEQIDRERTRRFGGATSRKDQLVTLLDRALAHDPFARVVTSGGTTVLEVRNALGDASLNTSVPLVDRP